MGLLRDQILKPGKYCGIPNCVLETPLLEPSDKLVYQFLLNALGENTDAWPSQKRIADKTAMSVRAVRYAIRRLEAVGLISTSFLANCNNHYEFHDAEEAITRARAAAVAVPPPEGPAKLAVPIRQSLPVPPAKLAAEVQKEQPKLNNRTLPTPPAAAERDEHHPDLDQGDEPVKPKPNRNLLKVWKQQKRSLPSPAKLESSWKLLAIQEKQTNQMLDPNAIQPDDSLEFLDLFKRTASGLYHWQELQARDLSRSAKSLRQEGSASQIEEIYQAYPRKIAKGAALKAITAAIKLLTKSDPSQNAAKYLLEKVKRFAVSPKGNLGQYTPYPSTFFNQARYLDDETEWGVTENRSGNLKREVVEVEDDEPGETFQDFCNRKNKEK